MPKNRTSNLKITESLRAKILNLVLFWFSILGTIVLIINFLRATQVSPVQLPYQYLFILISIWMLVLYRNKLSTKFKLYSVLIIALLLVSLGMYFLGFLASSKYYIIIAPLLFSFLASYRNALWVFFSFILIFAIFSFLHYAQILTIHVNITEYIINPYVWILDGLIVLTVTFVLLFIGKIYTESFSEQICVIEEQNKKLGEQESFFRLIFEKAADGILIGRSNGIITQVNAKACELTGYSKDEILNKHIGFLFCEDELHKEPLHFDDILKGKEVLLERNFKCKNGNLRKMQMHSQMLGDGQLQAIFRDVSSLNKLKRDLEDEQILKSSIISSIPGIFYIYDLETYKLILWNENYSKMLGYFNNDLRDKYIFNFFDDENFERFEVALKQVLKNGFGELEASILKKDGTKVPFHFQGYLFEMGEKKYISGVGIDISERKELERQVYISSVKSEEDERGRIAKDLHDGLGPIISTCRIYLHSIKNGKKEDIPEAIENLEELIDEALQGIKEISNNISPHILRNFGLVHALKSFVGKIKSNCNLIVECWDDSDDRLEEIRELTLYRVCTELINNGLKYSEADVIRLVIDVVDNKFITTYYDNGKGFVFDDIYGIKKNGFGLVNVHSRIKAIDGKIDFVTSPGNGVVVKMEIDLIRR